MKIKFTPRVVLLLAALMLIIILHGFAADLPLSVSRPMTLDLSTGPSQTAPVQVPSPQHLTVEVVSRDWPTNSSPTNGWPKNHWPTNNLPATNY